MFQVNDGPVISETYTGTIPAGETVSFTFNQTIDMSAVGGYIITVTVSINGDEIKGFSIQGYMNSEKFKKHLEELENYLIHVKNQESHIKVIENEKKKLSDMYFPNKNSSHEIFNTSNI